MRTPAIANLSLISAVVAALLQAGAQLFAIVVVVSTVTAAPPRSLAMYAGTYGYNSGPFWDVMPTVTFGLLLLALAGNWRTPRRRLLLAAAMRVRATAGPATPWDACRCCETLRRTGVHRK